MKRPQNDYYQKEPVGSIAWFHETYVRELEKYADWLEDVADESRAISVGLKLTIHDIETRIDGAKFLYWDRGNDDEKEEKL